MGVKLDIGAGGNTRPGFEGVDSVKYPGIKHVMDLSKEWTFKDGSASEISCSHFLEHFPMRESFEFMKKFHKTLELHGKLTVEVPDLEWTCKFFLENPEARYADSTKDDRGIAFLYGQQNNSFELHKTGFTVEWLEAFFRSAGFKRTVIKKAFSHGMQVLIGEAAKWDLKSVPTQTNSK